MISCLVIHLDPGEHGVGAREIRLADETIEIGRAAACGIHLPDHRVEPLHARVRRAADGSPRIEAQGDAFMAIDGFAGRAATLAPGMRIDIGPYRIDVGSPQGDAELVLSLTPTAAAHAVPHASEALLLSLAALGIGKRRLGFTLAIIVLVVGFALPLLPRASSAFDAWLARPLSPGPLSRAHTALAGKCDSCHARAFVAVADSACGECHARVPAHLADEATAKHGDVRCPDCHAAHAAKAATTTDVSRRCRACHERGTNERARRALDFGEAHPPFRLAVADGKRTLRVAQDAALPAEKPGLRFSHAAHLVKTGVSTPDGDVVLGCSDCHRLDAAGERFAPMRMEQTCQQSRCHKLRFAEPVFGTIPHGTEAAVMDRLRAAFAVRMAEDPGGYGRECGTSGNALGRALACAGRLAADHAERTLFHDSGEALQCGLCHEIRRDGPPQAPWKVAPVRVDRDWQPAAEFPHARHATHACTDCHDKAGSKAGADISFPAIDKCRECHAGADAQRGRLASACADCHRFHRVAAVN